MNIPSYPKVYNINHILAENVLDGIVLIEEKIDGSLFLFTINDDGNLVCRSKRADINLYGPPDLFAGGVKYIRSIVDKIDERYVYYGECLMNKKHNVISYSRIPNNHIILFDIQYKYPVGKFVSYDELKDEADRIGLETVPLLYEGPVESKQSQLLTDLLTKPSILGGAIEGIVIKNYGIYGKDGKPVFAKIVNEFFNESKNIEWKKSNPTLDDILDGIISRFDNEARWNKALVRGREDGMVTNTLSDIGFLINSVCEDILTEEEENIKNILFEFVKGKLRRKIGRGIPNWYKSLLGVDVQ